ncbi:MAG TPA: hypothetical protein VF914_12465 [Chloroflexia bacterium]
MYRGKWTRWEGQGEDIGSHGGGLVLPPPSVVADPCCGEVQWAFNLEQPGFIEKFVRAEMSDSRGSETLASRLPGRMKNGDNKEEVLQYVGKLWQMFLRNCQDHN